jgi:hypothetical protein
MEKAAGLDHDHARGAAIRMPVCQPEELAAGFLAMPAVSAGIYVGSIRSMRPWFAGLLYLVASPDSVAIALTNSAGFARRIARSA